MGEIFLAEKPPAALEFTGERLTSSASGQIEIEHFHRYFLARSFCRDKDVLDIAAGEGYGAAFLAQVARSVVGVEIAPQVAAHAARAYCRPNLRFVAGDGRAIPLRSGSVDIVVSFETIEHLFEQDVFVSEVKRVLRPGGIFVVSTPDRDVYSPYNSPANPFHCHELTKQEFIDLLSPTFRFVRCMGQRPMLGSAMVLDASRDEGGMGAQTYERRGDKHIEACAGLARSLYIVAFAADHPIAVPSSSLYIESSHLDLRDQQLAQEVQQRAAKQHAAAIAASERTWTERQAEWQHRLTEAMMARDQSEAARRRSQEELARVVSSTAWQMTYPLRRIAAKIPPRLRQLLRRLIRVAWWCATLQLGVKLRERRSRLAAIQARPPGEPARDPATTAAPGRPGSAAPHVFDPTPVLGINLPLVIRSVVLGIVTYNPDAAEFRRLIASAQIALERSGITGGTILVIDNGAETDPLTAGIPRVRRLPSDGNIGFGAGHNRLMADAFAAGAEVYIAVNPDGMLHPDAVTALLQEVQATQNRALVEAVQFPEEHPKFYDPATLDTAWASGACLAIPKKIYETIGGFDEIFFLYCEDVDFSWRARAAKFSIKVCPRALFFHRVTNRAPDPLTERRFRESGVILARKWRNPAFEQTLLSDLRRGGHRPPDVKPPGVPLEWQAVADFSHLFHFAPARW